MTCHALGIGNDFYKGSAIILFLADRLVVEAHTANALSQTDVVTLSVPDKSGALPPFEESPTWQIVRCRLDHFHLSPAALVAGNQSSRKVVKRLRIHSVLLLFQYRITGIYSQWLSKLRRLASPPRALDGITAMPNTGLNNSANNNRYIVDYINKG